MIVTPREIDLLITRSAALSHAIGCALQPELTPKSYRNPWDEEQDL